MLIAAAIVAALLLLFAIALICGANYLINFAIRRPAPLPPSDPATLSPFWQDYIVRNNAAIAELDSLPHEALTQLTPDGVRLFARFYPTPEGEQAHDSVIVVHGYRSGVGDFAMMTRWYRAQGFNVLVVENRAHGRSEGGFTGFGALDSRDCAGWCRILAERLPERRIFLHGISMGAATVSLAASLALPAQVAGVISDCSYSSALAQFRHVMTRDMHIPGWLAALLLPLASFFCRLRAGYFFGEASPVDVLPRTNLPFLFVHGDADDYVPTAMVHQLYAACPTKKQLLLVPEAGHGVSYAINPDLYEAAMTDFYSGLRSDR